MAKAVKHFVGRDTFGRNVERAQRFDGVWFARHDEYHERYGWRLSKWYEIEAPEMHTTLINQYSGETLECNPHMCWGFRRMHDITGDGKLRLRLPE